LQTRNSKMENFVIYNPVKLHFGNGVTGKLGNIAASFGKKAMLVYGKGSVKTNGSYDQAVNSLRSADMDIIEYAGIRPNPVVEDVDEAAQLGRKEGVDMVVAVGGGSVLDSAKYIALTIPVNHSCWDFVVGDKKPREALPMMGVLTLAATGSEMNAVAVVQNNNEKKKMGYGHPLMFPKHSFLDPGFTCSVPKTHTAYGIVDLIAHALEGWFGDGDASLTDKFIVSIIREAMEYGPKLMKDLTSYTLRAKIMYAATMALNGMTAQGKRSGDWGTHTIGHSMSVLWDIPHGASLSIAFPAWLSLQKKRIPNRIRTLGSAVFDVHNAEDTIDELKGFFEQLGSPVRLAQAGITTDEKAQEDLLEVMRINKVSGLHHKLSHEDHQYLVSQMF